jgi:hypothetical protein
MMRIETVGLRVLAAVLGVALLHGAAGDLAARQEQVLRGVVLDESGAPAPGIPLGLHRIGDDGGTFVADATSDAAGRFEMRVEAAASAEHIYFVTARYRDELYIGPTFRPPFPQDADYVVQVGLEETSASALMRGAGGVVVGPPPSPWRWALLGLFAVALLAATAVLLRRAAGPAPRRRLLIRIARLDEEYAGAGNAEALEDYRTERDRLLDRLRAID